MLTDLSRMTWGKFKGMQMQDVPPEYLLSVTQEEWALKKYPDLVEYVEEKKDKLEEMVKKT